MSATIDDPSIVEQDGHNFAATDAFNSDGRIEQLETWSFKVLEQGQATIAINSLQSSEPGPRVERTYQLVVSVE